MSDPAISLILPVKNSEKYLGELLRSVADQTFEDYELIIIDDGSTDRSGEVIASNGFKVSAHTRSEGAPAARNLGLSLARGKFVKFIDSDDMLMPRALEKQVAFARSLDSSQIGYGSRLDFGTHSSDGFRSLLHTPAVLPFDLHVQTSLPLHRREHLLQVGGFDTRCRVWQEWNLHVRLWEAGFRFVASEIQVLLYRHHYSAMRISNQHVISGVRTTHAFDTRTLTWRNFSESQKTPELHRWYLDQLFLDYYRAQKDRNLPLYNKISAELIASGGKLESQRYSVPAKLFMSLFSYEKFLKANAIMIALTARVSDISNLVPARKIQGPP